MAAAHLTGTDCTALDHCANGFPHDLFAVHRRAAPMFWHVLPIAGQALNMVDGPRRTHLRRRARRPGLFGAS